MEEDLAEAEDTNNEDIQENENEQEEEVAEASEQESEETDEKNDDSKLSKSSNSDKKEVRKKSITKNKKSNKKNTKTSSVKTNKSKPKVKTVKQKSLDKTKTNSVNIQSIEQIIMPIAYLQVMTDSITIIETISLTQEMIYEQDITAFTSNVAWDNLNRSTEHRWNNLLGVKPRHSFRGYRK